MTAPFHARDLKGRGRYYGPCREGCPLDLGGGVDSAPFMSVTNAQSVVAKPALVPAAVKITAAAAWDRLPRMVKLSRQGDAGPNGCATKRVADRCGECRFCLTAEIKREHDNQWEHMRDLGTRIHYTAADKILGGQGIVEEDVAPFIGQYAAFLRALDVDVVEDVYAVETTVYDPDRLYAGTGDVAVELAVDPISRRRTKGKRLWLLDIKTSITKPASTVYADQVLQLAALRYAPRLVLVDDTDQANPEYAGAALLNLRADAHAMIPLPADKTAHEAFVHALGLQRFFHDHVNLKAWQTLDLEPVAE